jgi:hypothetical protein
MTRVAMMTMVVAVQLMFPLHHQQVLFDSWRR